MRWNGMKARMASSRGAGRWWRACAVLCGACSLGGCASSELASPKTRIGALPFPGVASLYAAADPKGVTPHRYEGGLRTAFAAEGDRGIIYTERAGFIDMAHLREAMDWTWYVARLLDASAPEDGERVVRFRHECVEATLRIPAGLDAEDRADVAAMAAYRLLTWHEVSTWYGYSLIAFVSEKRSTFTVDDTTSHVLGAGVGRELVETAPVAAAYDAAADEALERLMRDLGAMDPAATTRMCERVKESWWKAGNATLFDAHVALEGGLKRPLLVREGGGIELGQGLGGASPRREGLASELGDWWTLKVSGSAAREVERVLGRREVRGDAELARLVEDVAAQLASSGARVVRDDDATAANAVARGRE